jgi:hypothetical protein
VRCAAPALPSSNCPPTNQPINPLPPQILEYHHKRTKSSLLHPQLPALHRVSAGSLLPGSDAGSRPSTPIAGGSGAFGKQGSLGGRRGAGISELLLKSQSVWSEAGGGGGPPASDASFGGGAPQGRLGGTGGSSSGLSDGQSVFGSRQSSSSRRPGGGGGTAAADTSR